jgi:hypothetical protein
MAAEAHCTATAAALVLLTRAENDDAAGSGADHYPSLLALASTCHALWAAAAPRRARLAAACWLRAFGRDTLGPCAAWQRIEQLGGDAFQARWRWLHALRAGAAVRESVVAHTPPSAAQLDAQDEVVHDTEFPLGEALDPATGAWRERDFHMDKPCFVAVDGCSGAPPLEALVCCVVDVPYRVTFGLRSGAPLAVAWEGFGRANAASLFPFGGIAAACFSRAPALLELTGASELHALHPSPQPHEHLPNAGAWSADGTRLALWSRFHRLNPGNNIDGVTTVHVYATDGDAPPGALAPAHTLHLPQFSSLAFGGGGAVVYTLTLYAQPIPSTLRAHELASGAQLAAVSLTAEPEPLSHFAALVVPLSSELCVSQDRVRPAPRAALRCHAAPDGHAAGAAAARRPRPARGRHVRRRRRAALLRRGRPAACVARADAHAAAPPWAQHLHGAAGQVARQRRARHYSARRCRS